MRVLKLTLAALAAATLAPVAAQAQGDSVIGIRSDDAAMNAAIAKGRQTLPDFWTHFAAPGPGESGFVIKYDLMAQSGEAPEYIWAEVISHAPGTTIARLANTPRASRWKLGEKVSVRDADIIDWGYYRNGVMQGHYTTRILLPHLDPAQAESIRKAYRW